MENKKEYCPTCGHIISEREIALFQGMVNALWRAMKWSKEKEIHEFEMGDVKHLFSQIEYARFGDWVLFGGLVYKKGRGKYGLNLQRCHDFFSGVLAIPTTIWKNPVTKMIRKENYMTIDRIPSILEMLNQDREYVVLYRTASPRLEDIGEIIKIPSKTHPGVTYTITLTGQKATCDCEGFRFRGRCSHTDDALQMERKPRPAEPKADQRPNTLFGH